MRHAAYNILREVAPVMGRPKGSKNKPKILAPPQETAPPIPVPAPLIVVVPVVEKKRGRPRKVKETGKIVVTELNNCPAEINLDEAPVMGFYPVNMSHFLFTEHRLLKVADFVLGGLTPEQTKQHEKDAKLAKTNGRLFLLMKMLKAGGWTKTQIDDAIREIDDYKQRNKPTQLYLKYKKR